MLLRPFFFAPTACASYLFGCGTTGEVAVLDPHAELVERYLAAAEEAGVRIVAVLETHVQADHLSGLPELVERTGATAHLPAGADVDFAHTALGDGERLALGNTIVTALATPGHAPAHASYLVADRRRGDERPWILFSGDTLLIGDVGRPDLHAGDDPRAAARLLHASLRRLAELPDELLLLPSHYGGSVCGRALSGNPFSTLGFERSHNRLLTLEDAAAFADAVLADLPPRPEGQERIVAANRGGRRDARV